MRAFHRLRERNPLRKILSTAAASVGGGVQSHSFHTALKCCAKMQNSHYFCGFFFAVVAFVYVYVSLSCLGCVLMYFFSGHSCACCCTKLTDKALPEWIKSADEMMWVAERHLLPRKRLAGDPPSFCVESVCSACVCVGFPPQNKDMRSVGSGSLVILNYL